MARADAPTLRTFRTVLSSRRTAQVTLPADMTAEELDQVAMWLFDIRRRLLEESGEPRDA